MIGGEVRPAEAKLAGDVGAGERAGPDDCAEDAPLERCQRQRARQLWPPRGRGAERTRFAFGSNFCLSMDNWLTVQTDVGLVDTTPW